VEQIEQTSTLQEHDRARFEVDVTATPNGYGFGYDWSLEVIERGLGNKVYGHNVLSLGQNVKVVSRLLGITMDQLLADSAEATGTMDWDDANRQYLAKRLADALAPDGDYSVLLRMQPWEAYETEL
jgi:hypothetical protein